MDLKKELKTRGLSTIGTKNELMERLQDAIQDDDSGENGALDNDDLLDEEAVLAEESDEAILEEGNANLIAQEDDAVLLTPTVLSAPKIPAEKTTQSMKKEVSVPKKVILNRKSTAAITSPVSTVGSVLKESEQKSDSQKTNECNEKEGKTVIKITSLSAEERAKLRAAKFGVPIPDSVKKAVRAERFGGATTTGTTTNAKVEDDKLLKRQARFGNVKAEVDEKKQKRAERFGTTTASTSMVSGNGNDVQKQKRAERFGLA